MAVSKKDRHVSYRERVIVRGVVSPATAGRSVALEYAPRGGRYRRVAKATTGDDGRWRVSARPRESGLLRAVSDDGQTSKARSVVVVPRASARTRRNVKRGSLALVRGRITPGRSGRTILVQTSRGRGWSTVDRARTRRGGSFKAVWRARTSGIYRVRIVFRGDRRNAATARRAPGRLTVYRPAHASWYGPGFYGNRTACGQTLGYNTLGVAHKTMPCGTRLTLRNGRHSVRVRVIDRGPYIAGREFDLTGATKRALRFGSTGTIWSSR